MTGQDEVSSKKWYKRVSVWAAATTVTAIATFTVGIIVRYLEAGIEKIGDPLTVVAGRINSCQQQYVVPLTNSEGENGREGAMPTIGSARSVDEWEESIEKWRTAVGAMDSEYSRVSVVVTGKSDRPVVLRSLEIDVLNRREPLKSENLLFMSDTCGDDVEVRYLSYNLDRRPPRLVQTVDGRNGSADLGILENPVAFPYRVSETESEVFEVRVHTRECDCEWQLRLHWITGDESGELIINNEGKPFRTSAVSF